MSRSAFSTLIDSWTKKSSLSMNGPYNPYPDLLNPPGTGCWSNQNNPNATEGGNGQWGNSGEWGSGPSGMPNMPMPSSMSGNKGNMWGKGMSGPSGMPNTPMPSSMSGNKGNMPPMAPMGASGSNGNWVGKWNTDTPLLPVDTSTENYQGCCQGKFAYGGGNSGSNNTLQNSAVMSIQPPETYQSNRMMCASKRMVTPYMAERNTWAGQPPFTL